MEIGRNREKEGTKIDKTNLRNKYIVAKGKKERE